MLWQQKAKQEHTQKNLTSPPKKKKKKNLQLSIHSNALTGAERTDHAVWGLLGEASTNATCQGTLFCSYLRSLSHSGLMLGLKTCVHKLVSV